MSSEFDRWDWSRFEKVLAWAIYVMVVAVVVAAILRVTR